MSDFRLAVRALLATPVVAGLAVLSLALGIGANTAIFSLIDGLLLRPLPVREPQALVLLTDASAPGIRSYGYAVWTQIHQHAELFDGSIAWAPEQFALNRRGEIQVVDGLWVSGSFFETLGVTPLLGRTLTAADDRRDGGANGPAVAIGYGFWQRRFGGAADIIGRTLTLDDATFTIVGVMPPGFYGPEVGRAVDVFVPLGTEPFVRGRDSAIDGAGCCLGLTIMVRLKPGQSIDAATGALRGVQPQIREATLPRDGRWRKQDIDRYMRDAFALAPGATGTSRLWARYERPLLALMVVVALVLLIACANIANLLLARAIARQHELRVRLALGATRWRLVRQLLAESAVIAVAGAMLGVVMASWASDLLVRQLSAARGAAVVLDLSLDRGVLAFTMAVTILVTLLAGIAPALRAVRLAAVDALKSHAWATPSSAGAGAATRAGAGAGAGASAGAGAGGVAAAAITATSTSIACGVGPGGVILIAQVAMSVVLVVAAGLFLRTFVSLARLPLGFDRDGVLMVSVSTERTRVPQDQRPALFTRTRDAVRAVPGVADAAISFLTPVGGPILLRPIDTADGVPLTLPERERLAAVNLISPGWFDTLGTSIISGRDFTERDTTNAPPVAIINQAFARKLLRGVRADASVDANASAKTNPNADASPTAAADLSPIGRTISIGITGPNAGSVEVIGVVADAVYASLREPVPPTMYFPLAQMRFQKAPLSALTMSVRATHGSPLALTNSITAAIANVDPDLAITFRPLADQVSASIAQERIVAMLSGFFGALAVLLAGLGLFGVTAYAVSRRRREIGIRIALGAAPASVMRLVLTRVMLLVGIGITVGAGLSLWASRFVAAMLYGLDPRDPVTLTIAAGLLATVGFVAAWLPARQAIRIDPAIVLRLD
jgi:putative ABC transport system permease protein